MSNTNIQKWFPLLITIIGTAVQITIFTTFPVLLSIEVVIFIIAWAIGTYTASHWFTKIVFPKEPI